MDSILVTNSAELYSAVRSLQSTGGTIEVAASDEPYTLTGYKLGSDTETIRIVAADGDNPPDFQNIKLNQCQNFSFEGLLFDSSTDVTRTGKDIEINGGQNIRFADNTFISRATGFYDPNDYDGYLGKNLGSIDGVENFTFEGNTVSNMLHALAITDSTGTQILNNDFSRLIGDGIRMGGMMDTLIEGNSFTEFYGSVQTFNHSDYIQVWATSSDVQNTENLVIRDNYFNSSGGHASQTIFIKNETFVNTGEPFRNIVIENNTILNGHVHGVTMYNVEDARIANNTILWDQDAGMQSSSNTNAVSHPPTIRLYNVDNSVVENNISSGIYKSTDSDSVTQNNMTLNYVDPSASNYVGTHFVNATGAGVLDERDLAMLPDSPWVGVYGALDGCLTELGEPGSVVAVARQYTAPENSDLVIYDASECLGVNPATATYRWVFDDGTVLEGETVQRLYSGAGTVGFDLQVTCAAGTDSIHRETLVVDKALLVLDFDEVVADASSYAIPINMTDGDFLVEGIDGLGTAYHLEGTNKVVVDGSTMQLRALEAFSLGVSVKLDPGSDGGAFLHMHRGIEAKVNADGTVQFSIGAGGDYSTVKTDPGAITAETWHRINIVFNGTAEQDGLKLYVDGELAGTAEASGTFLPPAGNNLVLGHAWNASLKGAVDKLYITREVMTDTMVDRDYRIAHNLELPDVPPVSPLADADLLSMDLQGDAAQGDGAAPLAIDVLAEDTAFGAEGFALGDASRLRIDRGNTALHEIDTFTFAATLKLDDAGATGRIFDMYRGMSLEVTKGGGLKFMFSNGTVYAGAESDTGLVGADAWHRVVVSYDGTDGGAGAAIYLDGALVASADLSGGLSPNASGRYHLFIGDTWGSDALDATIKDIALTTTALDADGVAQDTAAWNWVPGGAELADPASSDGAQPVADEPPTDADADSFLLDIDFADGVVDQSSHDSKIAASADGQGVAGVTGDGFHLDGSTRVFIARDNDQLRDLDSFTISLALQRDADGDAGTFLHMHQGMEAKIDADGSLHFGIATTDGWVALQTDPGLLTDTDWHDIHIALDGDTDLLTLYVDGTSVAETAATGSFIAPSSSHLYVGHAFNPSMQATVDNIRIRDLAIDADTAASEHAEMQDALADTAAITAYADLFRTAIGEEQLVLIDDTPADIADGALLDGDLSADTLSSMDIDISAGFSLSMALQGDGDGDGMAAATLARLTGAFEASITENRALRVQITTDQGSFEAVSEAGAISDSAFQKLVIAYDGSTDAGGLAAFVDGDLVAANIEATGALPIGDAQAMEIGGALSPDVLISEYGLSAFSLGTSGPEDEQESSVLETSIA